MSKSLTSAETYYSNLWAYYMAYKNPSLLLCPQSQHDKRSKTADGNFQGIHRNTQIAKNIATHSPIEQGNSVHTLTLTIHSRLAILTKPWGRDEEIPDMCITINAMESCMDIPDCMTADKIRQAILDNEPLGMLSEYILHGWPPTKAEVQNELQLYWSFIHKIALIDEITMKGRRIIVPVSL